MKRVSETIYLDVRNSVISRFAEKGFFVDSSLLKFDWNNFEIEKFIEYAENQNLQNKLITKSLMDSYSKTPETVVLKPKKFKNETQSNVKVVRSFKTKRKNYGVKDWASYYNNRYEQLRDLLLQRVEMRDVTSIGNLYKNPDNQQVSTIGMVNDIRITKKGNYLIIIEDPTGKINCVVNAYKKDMFELCKEVVMDEVIGIKGKRSGEFIWVDSVIFPDIYIEKIKKSPHEGSALFLSDIHVGSKRFQHKSFQKFIDWLNGKEGNERQRKIAKNIKYIFVAGDVVDGIGIYPGHEKELEIKDIYKQYEILGDYLKQIPENIPLILLPGNHDAIRLAEPQHTFYKDIAAPLYELSNAHLVSNPSTVNIDAYDGFEGFNVLGYHGYSYDYYANEVEAIREQGSYNAIDVLMKVLLKKRHLAPTHGSTPLVPTKKDNMVIDVVPDIFTSGHIHKSKVSNYKNITLISASCWQSTTIFQEKLGHKPDPGRVPMMNLKTRDMSMLNFW